LMLLAYAVLTLMVSGFILMHKTDMTSGFHPPC